MSLHSTLPSNDRLRRQRNHERSHASNVISLARGASGKAPAELRDANYLDSIQQTASIARYVRVKFYRPREDGSEPWIDYEKVFNMLRGV